MDALIERIARGLAAAGFPLEPTSRLAWSGAPRGRPRARRVLTSAAGEVLLDAARYARRTVESPDALAEALTWATAYESGRLRFAEGASWRCLVLVGETEGRRRTESLLTWLEAGECHRVYLAAPLEAEAVSALLFAAFGAAPPTAWREVDAYGDEPLGAGGALVQRAGPLQLQRERPVTFEEAVARLAAAFAPAPPGEGWPAFESAHRAAGFQHPGGLHLSLFAYAPAPAPAADALLATCRAPGFADAAEESGGWQFADLSDGEGCAVCFAFTETTVVALLAVEAPDHLLGLIATRDAVDAPFDVEQLRALLLEALGLRALDWTVVDLDRA